MSTHRSIKSRAGASAMFRRSTTMKQKAGVHMNHSTTGSGKPSKRRWFIFALIYSFVFVFIVAGVADLFLIMKSIVRRASNSDLTTPSLLNHNNKNGNMYMNDIRNNIGKQRDPNDRCAINFFGLPRAFESLVLPSIIKNIITPNPGCDYYVHYYHMTEELQGRSGGGGTIDPTAILLLRDAVHNAARQNGDENTPLPIVEFVFDKEEDFWKKYSILIERIRTTVVNGKYLYFPWKAKTYQHPVTTDNIVKMWHSIQSSYQLMEDVAASKNIEYKIVAMLRSDVVYVTPINIHDAPKRPNNAYVPVTVPNFGKHPVSDRIIYGPREAVKIWATQRFAHLESHVDFILKNDPGWGMHSERFVNYTLFPLIQNVTKIRQHPSLCFFRARADESVWVSDCYSATRTVAAPSIMEHLLKGGRTLLSVVQDAIGRPCSGTKPVRLTQSVRSLACSKIATASTKTDNKAAIK